MCSRDISADMPRNEKRTPTIYVQSASFEDQTWVG